MRSTSRDAGVHVVSDQGYHQLLSLLCWTRRSYRVCRHYVTMHEGHHITLTKALSYCLLFHYMFNFQSPCAASIVRIEPDRNCCALSRTRRAEVQTTLATLIDSVVRTSVTAVAVPPHCVRVAALFVEGMIATLWFFRGRWSFLVAFGFFSHSLMYSVERDLRERSLLM